MLLYVVRTETTRVNHMFKPESNVLAKVRRGGEGLGRMAQTLNMASHQTAGASY